MLYVSNIDVVISWLQHWKFLYKEWAHEIVCGVVVFILWCTKMFLYLHADSKCKLQPMVCFKYSVRLGWNHAKLQKKISCNGPLFYFIKPKYNIVVCLKKNFLYECCYHGWWCWCHFSSYNFKYFISSCTLNILIVMKNHIPLIFHSFFFLSVWIKNTNNNKCMLIYITSAK